MRRRTALRARALQSAVVCATRSLVAGRAELATAAAFLAGWALVTHGVARLTSSLAWTFSGGLLCLSLGGWRLLWTIVVEGMYALTRAGDERAGGPRG